MQSQAGHGPSANGQELEDMPWASSPLPILPVGKQEIAFFPPVASGILSVMGMSGPPTPWTCLTPVIFGLGIDEVADGSLTTRKERLQMVWSQANW